MLIDDARRDADDLGRLETEREAAAVAFAAVNVAVDDAARAQRIDIAAVARVIADRARRELAAERHVDRALDAAAHAAAVDEVDVAFDQPLDLVELRLVGDVADRAADRARAEQRALRAAQRLDAVEIEQVEIGGEQRQRDDAFVEIDADLFLDARLVADDLPGRNTADRYLALPWPEVLDSQARDVARDILERRRARALDVDLRLRVDRERHVLQAAVALGRGDDDLVGVGGIRAERRSGSLRHRGASQREQRDAGKGMAVMSECHDYPPR